MDFSQKEQKAGQRFKKPLPCAVTGGVLRARYAVYRPGNSFILYCKDIFATHYPLSNNVLLFLEKGLTYHRIATIMVLF